MNMCTSYKGDVSSQPTWPAMTLGTVGVCPNQTGLDIVLALLTSTWLRSSFQYCSRRPRSEGSGFCSRRGSLVDTNNRAGHQKIRLERVSSNRRVKKHERKSKKKYVCCISREVGARGPWHPHTYSNTCQRQLYLTKRSKHV